MDELNFLLSPDEGGSGSSQNDVDPGQSQPLKDVSGLFNERGFYKANEFNFNEEEIINDFSGNLIYDIPLYHYKLPGDLQFDMKLAYNGSVGHSFKIANPSILNTGVKNTFNMNMAEWVLSVNGICVQSFNFIPNYFSKPPQNSSTLDGYNINMQIPGYHYTNDLRVYSENSLKDTILLLMGDGSTLTIENLVSSSNEDLRYIGEYRGKGKENYVKAKVEYYEPAAPYPYYRARKITLYKGDRLEYIFIENKNKFFDYQEDLSLRQKPMLPYLNQIRDRFGYGITFDYSAEYSNDFGRHLLSGIHANAPNSQGELVFSLSYTNRFVKIDHQSDLNKEYWIYFEDEGVYYDPNFPLKNRIGRVTKIINSLNQTFEVEYKTNSSDEYYQRKYTGVYNPFGPTLEVDFNKLKRIRKTKNFLGLRRIYNYKDPVPTTLNVNNLYVTDPLHILSNGFKGYGRDYFFTNMISYRTEYYVETSTINKNKLTFVYNFTPADLTRVLARYPIHKDDILITSKYISSLDTETINSSAAEIVKTFEYHIFPLYNPNDHFAFSPDSDGATKLLKENTDSNGNGSVHTIKDFEFEIGTGNPLNGGYNGSFLMKKKIENYEGILRQWEWQYVHKDSNPENFIIESREKDPFGETKVKKFKDYFIDCLRCNYNNDFPPDIPTIPYKFFKYNILEEEYIELVSSPGVKNNRRKNYFIDITNDNRGYIGQLLKEEIYENIGTLKIETSYIYCKNDRTGEEIFEESGVFPYKEGALKEMVKPNGEVTKYYYHPISFQEVVMIGDASESFPHLKYLVKYNNGNIVEENELIWDHRLPVRTDNVKRTAGVDQILLTSYKTYSADGSPKKSFDSVKFLTQFKYGLIHRINKITFPGDFSTQPDGEETIIINNPYYADLALKSNKWGYINLDSSEGYFANVPTDIGTNCKHFYGLYRYDKQQPEFDRRNAAFIGYNFQSLGIPLNLEIADLKVNFVNFIQLFNQQPYLPKRLISKGVLNFVDIHGENVLTLERVTH